MRPWTDSRPDQHAASQRRMNTGRRPTWGGVVRQPLAVCLMVAVIAGCATSKDAPLALGPAGPEFFVGTWTGSFEWREQAKTDPRPISVTITSFTADGGVVGDLVYLALRSPGSRGMEPIAIHLTRSTR